MRYALALVCVSPVFAADVLEVSPSAARLDGPESTLQLLVARVATDRTHRATYEVADPTVASVTAGGLVEPRGEGTTEIRVQDEGRTATVRVTVTGVRSPAPVSFEQQVMPLLTKAGCNSGGCHGKAEGQNGFKLSVFGFDPEADHRAITAESRGRRVFPASPESSLLVTKGTGSTPHGGGRKLQEGTLPYKRLVRWIAEGASRRTESSPPLAGVEVEPSDKVLSLGGVQQLRVTAVDAKGQRRDVTAEAEFESNATTIAGVDRGGRVQAATIPGEAAVLVRYLGLVTVARITVPRAGTTFTRPPEANFVDGHVWDKLTKLGIPPSDLAADSTFLRRVSLDVIGTLPTAEEAREFLTDSDPKKRAKLIDRLLDRPEYADYWAMKWADLLRVDRDVLGANGAVAFHRWLRQQFADNRPYDQFARDVLTAEGKVASPGPAGLFRALGTPEAAARSLSQLFLGVRIECAQCHHHPSDRWGQEDYFALAGFFTGVTRKGTPGSEAVVSNGGSDFKHPRTGKPIATRVLGGSEITFADRDDRRAAFADWMTAPDNPYFARLIVNRLWAHYFGRGLVEPVDDLRPTNPAVSEPLLAALAKHLIDSKYDLKAVARTLLNSRAYQLAGATKENADDDQNFSHARSRTLPAEVLLDAIGQATGVPEKFNGTPEGTRAIQLWDNRMPSYFLQLFGRPARVSVCECERSSEPSVSQALHLMNAEEIEAKIRSRRGVARKLADGGKTPAAIVEELYLSTHSRFPTKAEVSAVLDLFNRNEAITRREAVEDVLWTLLNTKDFLYNR